jgi:putative Holliday junction resolvase
LGRIIAIDYGLKRTGIAVTDPLKIIANALTTIESQKLIPFLKDYFKKEEVECIVIGDPKRLNGEPTHSTQAVNEVILELQKTFPSIPINKLDERFTSKIAFQSMIDAGLKKKVRKDKALIDKVSATIILQSYLEQRNFDR